MCKAISLVITVIVLQSHWGLVEVAAIPGCDRSAAIACGEVALRLSEATGCNWDVVLPWYDDCLFNATGSCSGEEQQEVWQQYITGFEAYLRGSLCNTACPDQQARLTEINNNCRTLSGGLSSLGQSILDSTNVQPTDTICTGNLQRTKDCMDAASTGCPIVEDQAFTMMYEYRDAFTKCGITLPDKQPVRIDDIINDGMMVRLNTSTTTTTAGPDVQMMSDIDDTTTVTLYSIIGLSALIILGAGVTTLVICANKRKQDKLKKQVEKINEKNQYTFETRRYDKYPNRPHRPSRPHRQEPQEDRDIDFDDNASEESVGPYRPSGRWWTRPEFGIGQSPGPIDRQFRPWPGFRNNNF